MKKVITYGTFDLFHEGHRWLLERAKALGDYLIVGVTSERFDRERGKLNVKDSLEKRIEAVLATGYVDEIVIEDQIGQKIDDIERLSVDLLAIGNDWVGKFDYLSKYCDVLYLERTPDVSSTILRGEGAKLLRVGIIADRLDDGGICDQAYSVSGLEVSGVYVPDKETEDVSINSEAFRARYDLAKAFETVDSLHEWNNAVYIHTRMTGRFDYAAGALRAGCHVICDVPLNKPEEAEELKKIAAERGLLFAEYTPIAFILSETTRSALEKGELA